MNKGELAKSYFLKGYNCSQAIVATFKDELNIDENTLLKLASPFGGGMGRLRETCGAFTAIIIILGLIKGYSSNETGEKKQKLYSEVQTLAKLFEEKNGSIKCNVLLNKPEGKDSPVPSIRDEGFYKSRPCANIIYNAANILEEYLKSNPR